MKLLELLLGIVILGIIASISFGSLTRYRTSQEVLRSVDLVVDALGKARTDTVASKGAQQYGVHIDEDAAVLFKGAAYSPGSSLNAIFEMPERVRLATSSIGNSSNILFKRLSGATDQAGYVYVRDLDGVVATRTIQVLSTGIITLP